MKTIILNYCNFTQFHLYVSVNKRSLLAGMQQFQKAIIDMQYALINGNREAYDKHGKLRCFLATRLIPCSTYPFNTTQFSAP